MPLEVDLVFFTHFCRTCTKTCSRNCFWKKKYMWKCLEYTSTGLFHKNIFTKIIYNHCYAISENSFYLLCNEDKPSTEVHYKMKRKKLIIFLLPWYTSNLTVPLCWTVACEEFQIIPVHMEPSLRADGLQNSSSQARFLTSSSLTDSISAHFCGRRMAKILNGKLLHLD